ncbi:CsbD family protein [Streptomyces sp. CBMA152]|uniref:CsbD family protein n=1 Tax=Streptomyces sp. CBMA152 TaxID=1896312 RepID=UPI0016615280|nr:CsbD family protein [Streptomyces sp. CBMA152]MBD0746724.1 general stress protein CsbD [Streptomyces sp. CBMA152]
MADKGGTDKVKGKAKEALGKATGDKRTTAEGKMDQAMGKAKEAVADVKDSLRGRGDER